VRGVKSPDKRYIHILHRWSFMISDRFWTHFWIYKLDYPSLSLKHFS
jgi:hypothetical protein